MTNYATMAGNLLAGTDPDEISEVPRALLIEFESAEALRAALEEGVCTFEFGRKPETADEVSNDQHP